jgi:site-specific DNA-methyltransferase (adenine-specific)
MKTLPDKSIDLFICDLPYGCLNAGRKQTGKWYDRQQTVGKGCAWDIKIDLEAFWIQVERLMKTDHTPIIHFCSTKFGFDLYNSNPNWFRYDLVWEKTLGVGFLNANKQPMRSHENIYVFAKKGANYYRKDIEGDFKGQKMSGIRTNHVYGKSTVERTDVQEGRRCVKSVFQFANKKGKHPTQKPLDLYKFLIERYSKEGDTVLDPTAGSFTSGLACKELNRNYIGIEMDDTFYKKGLELLQECP